MILPGASCSASRSAGARRRCCWGSHSGSSLVLLDAALTLLAEADAAQATAVTCTDTAAYLIENNTVACYTQDGSLRWVHAYESRPQLVLDAAQDAAVHRRPRRGSLGAGINPALLFGPSGSFGKVKGNIQL